MKHAQIISALVLLTTGVILSFIGFFTEPVGEISDSVLWYFAQTLIYAGSVFGLKAYVDKMISSGSLKRLCNIWMFLFYNKNPKWATNPFQGNSSSLT